MEFKISFYACLPTIKVQTPRRGKVFVCFEEAWALGLAHNNASDHRCIGKPWTSIET